MFCINNAKVEAKGKKIRGKFVLFEKVYIDKSSSKLYFDERFHLPNQSRIMLMTAKLKWSSLIRKSPEFFQLVSTLPACIYQVIRTKLREISDVYTGFKDIFYKYKNLHRHYILLALCPQMTIILV